MDNCKKKKLTEELDFCSDIKADIMLNNLLGFLNLNQLS